MPASNYIVKFAVEIEIHGDNVIVNDGDITHAIAVIRDEIIGHVFTRDNARAYVFDVRDIGA